MRLAVISDTHFGDPMCQLAGWDESGNKAVIKDRYDEFKSAAGVDNDYLILLGDILDFSVCSYEETYRVAKAFFKQVQADRIARYMVYIPGNHDADMWHFYEHQANVINRVIEGKPPRNFRFSIPAIFDVRTNRAGDEFRLFGINKSSDDPQFGYGGMFIDSITQDDVGGVLVGAPMKFAFAYPNAYLITDSGTILLTHGHYLEDYWTLVSEWGLKIFEKDLEIGTALDLRELVAINFPFSQLTCSGLGQAGPLTKVVQQIQSDVKRGELSRVKKYADAFGKEIDSISPAGWTFDPREAASDIVIAYAKRKLLEALAKREPTRYSDEFIHKNSVLDRFRRFFDATLLEIDEINRAEGLAIPAPHHVIFGHTHQPIAFGDPNAPRTISSHGSPVTLYNTGGWLSRFNPTTGKEEFCGAEIMTFDSLRDPAMSSTKVL